MIASAIDQKGRGVEKHEVGGAEKVNADALRDKQGNPNWNAILKWSPAAASYGIAVAKGR